MSERPVVSVVVPTYNREGLLPISVNSVRGQTFQDWELLIVDDRSTDGTKALVESWAREDSRIRYVPNTRAKGPSGARNQGIDEARGKYVALLDSDDEWLPCHLAASVSYFDTYPDRVDCVSADAIRKVRATGEVYQQPGLNLSKIRHERLGEAYLLDPPTVFAAGLGGFTLVTQTLVMKREVVEKVRFAEDLLPGPEDIFFQWELAYGGVRMAYLPEPHVVYWAHGDNLTLAGGTGDVRGKLPLFLAYEQMTKKTLERFDLTAEQGAGLRDWLARLYFWHIGYNSYLMNGDARNARRFFLKALRIQPWKLGFWKTYLASFFKPRKASCSPAS
jgi:glycosyltransferase involved in cell wall biosynthesis